MPCVLFVCTANQFRSPLCAAIFEKLLHENGVAEGWAVKSAGTWVSHTSKAHPTAIREANKIGLDLTRHESHEITRSMIEETDLVVVMTQSQKEALQIEFPEEKKKMVMLTELSSGMITDIPDPAEIGFNDIEAIVRDINEEVVRSYSQIIKRVAK